MAAVILTNERAAGTQAKEKPVQRDLITVHVRLERPIHDALRAAAEADERPLAATIRRQLRRWLISTGHLKSVAEPVEVRRAE